MFSRTHLVNSRHNSDARSKYEVESMLRYESKHTTLWGGYIATEAEILSEKMEASQNRKVSFETVGLSQLFGVPEFLRFPRGRWMIQIARVYCQMPDKRKLVNDHAATPEPRIFLDLGYFLFLNQQYPTNHPTSILEFTPWKYTSKWICPAPNGHYLPIGSLQNSR